MKSTLKQGGNQDAKISNLKQRRKSKCRQSSTLAPTWPARSAEDPGPKLFPTLDNNPLHQKYFNLLNQKYFKSRPQKYFLLENTRQISKVSEMTTQKVHIDLDNIHNLKRAKR